MNKLLVSISFHIILCSQAKNYNISWISSSHLQTLFNGPISMKRNILSSKCCIYFGIWEKQKKKRKIVNVIDDIIKIKIKNRKWYKIDVNFRVPKIIESMCSNNNGKII